MNLLNHSGKSVSGADIAGTSKQYLVLSATEDQEEATYAINGVAYDINKFNMVDRGYSIPEIPEIMRPPVSEDACPAPTGVSAKIIKTSPFYGGAYGGLRSPIIG